MQKQIRLLISCNALLISFFCLLGFITTFEPVSNAIAFRVFYSILGIMATMIGIRTLYLAIKYTSLN